MSEGGDIPCDEGLSSSFESAVGGPRGIEPFFMSGRDADLRSKYPEFYRIFAARQSAPDETVGDASSELLYRDAYELCKSLRRTEKILREREKEVESLQTQNKQIRDTYGKIYARAEQEEEYISNILLKRIQKLKNDKETLAQKYEQEEEFLTNDLMRRIQQLQSERDSLEGKMKNEQSALIDNLLQTIRRMETEMASSRKNMDRMRKEKIDQENALENEQELLFNTLGKQMDQLNNEKKKMQASLHKAYMMGFIDADEITAPVVNEIAIPDRPPSASLHSGEVSPSLKISRLHTEISRLRAQLRSKDNSIAELNTKLELKNQNLRDIELTLNSILNEKDEFMNVVGEAQRAMDNRVQDLLGQMAARAQGPMGPPSVPSVPYSESADMDDASSRGSFHSDVMG